MKKKIAMFALAATLAFQTGTAAFAADNAAAELLLFPFRLVTGVAGGGLGLVAGGLQGIVETEKTFAEHTFAEVDENPLMLPVGLVGAAVAVPVGFLVGAPKGAVDWGAKGYNLWDEME